MECRILEKPGEIFLYIYLSFIEKMSCFLFQWPHTSEIKKNHFTDFILKQFPLQIIEKVCVNYDQEICWIQGQLLHVFVNWFTEQIYIVTTVHVLILYHSIPYIYTEHFLYYMLLTVKCWASIFYVILIQLWNSYKQIIRFLNQKRNIFKFKNNFTKIWLSRYKEIQCHCWILYALNAQVQQ